MARLIIELIVWVTMMAWGAVAIIFDNNLFGIFLFFVALLLFVVAIKEYSDRKKVSKMLAEWRENLRAHRDDPNNWSV